MSDEAEDRRAILARRAILVASALASAGVPMRAVADEVLAIPEPCPPRSEPAPESLAEARRLVDEASRDVDPQAVVVKLSRAYALAPRPGLAALLMEALVRVDKVNEAVKTGKRELECGGPNPEIERRVRELESPPPPPPPIPPEPCLSIAPPEPCLSISSGGEREERWALHVGLVPMVAIERNDDKDRYRVLGGGGTRVAIAVQAAPNLWFDGDLFSTLGYGEEHFASIAGTVVELRYHPGSVFGFGLGFAAGLSSISHEDADDDDNLPSEGFFGPVVIPASLLAGDALVELRVPLLFNATVDGEPKKDLAFRIISPQLVVSWGIKDKYWARAF
jgi:hypothetical protein